MPRKQTKTLEPKRDNPRHVAVAEALQRGASVRKAMVSAGYSLARANRGNCTVPKGVLNLLPRRGKIFAKLANAYNADKRAELVRGALVDNVLSGKDKATKSLELLGRDVAVGMFKSDGAQVAVQINIPVGLESFFPSLRAPESIEPVLPEE